MTPSAAPSGQATEETLERLTADVEDMRSTVTEALAYLVLLTAASFVLAWKR